MRVALKVFPQKPAVFVVVPTMEIITLVPSQASGADGGAKFQVVPYSTVWVGEQLKFGGMVSSTVMVCAQGLEVPHGSVAVSRRVIVRGQPLGWAAGRRGACRAGLGDD